MSEGFDFNNVFDDGELDFDSIEAEEKANRRPPSALTGKGLPQWVLDYWRGQREAAEAKVASGEWRPDECKPEEVAAHDFYTNFIIPLMGFGIEVSVSGRTLDLTEPCPGCGETHADPDDVDDEFRFVPGHGDRVTLSWEGARTPGIVKMLGSAGSSPFAMLGGLAAVLIGGDPQEEASASRAAGLLAQALERAIIEVCTGKIEEIKDLPLLDMPDRD